METLKDYEKKVVSLLISGVFSPDELNKIINDNEFVGLNKNGGSGYFLEVSNSSLPEKRIVCFEPQVIGDADGITCGFVIFIENGTLTIECHDWGESDITDDFREKDVRVRAVIIKEGKFVNLG